MRRDETEWPVLGVKRSKAIAKPISGRGIVVKSFTTTVMLNIITVVVKDFTTLLSAGESFLLRPERTRNFFCRLQLLSDHFVVRFNSVEEILRNGPETSTR